MSRVNWERVRSDLESLALAENMGDVNGDLPSLCQALGLPLPKWNASKRRLVMAWEEQ